MLQDDLVAGFESCDPLRAADGVGFPARPDQTARRRVVQPQFPHFFLAAHFKPRAFKIGGMNKLAAVDFIAIVEEIDVIGLAVIVVRAG